MKSLDKNQGENRVNFSLVRMIKFSIVIAIVGLLMCFVFLLGDTL